MNWQNAIAILSTLALVTPVFVIFLTKLVRYKYFFSLFIYCLVAFTYNLMTEDYLAVSKTFLRTFGIINNLLDAPLMFTFLMYFANSKKQRKMMSVILLVFLCFELIVVTLKGISIPTIVIVMGPGITLVFSFALYFFVQSIKRSFIHAKAAGKAFMSTAISFAYGCFAFIYIMFYLLKVPDSPYIFLVYFTVTIIYCTLLTIGLILESKRKRKLEELLITRKELYRFFHEEKKPATSGDITGQWRLN